MNGIPDNYDFGFFVGKMLIQICIGQYETILHFTEGISIEMYDCFHHIRDNIDMSSDVVLPMRSSSLLDLLGSSVVNVEVKRNQKDRIVLYFSNKDTLCITDKYDNYESFVVTNKIGSLPI